MVPIFVYVKPFIQ